MFNSCSSQIDTTAKEITKITARWQSSMSYWYFPMCSSLPSIPAGKYDQIGRQQENNVVAVIPNDEVDWLIPKLVGGLEHFLFSHILGMSSSQLTLIFFRGVAKNHQPGHDFQRANQWSSPVEFSPTQRWPCQQRWCWKNSPWKTGPVVWGFDRFDKPKAYWEVNTWQGVFNGWAKLGDHYSSDYIWL